MTATSVFIRVVDFDFLGGLINRNEKMDMTPLQFNSSLKGVYYKIVCTIFYRIWTHLCRPLINSQKNSNSVFDFAEIFECLRNSAVSNSGVRIENFGGLWLLFKGTIRQIFLLVKTIAIIGEKIVSIKIGGFTKPTYKVHTWSQNLRTF